MTDTWPDTPDEALRFLLEPATSASSAGTPTTRTRTPPAVRERRRAAAVRGDLRMFGLRVAAEIVFDRGLGDLFVVRTAGHLVGDEVWRASSTRSGARHPARRRSSATTAAVPSAAALQAHESGVTPPGTCATSSSGSRPRSSPPGHRALPIPTRSPSPRPGHRPARSSPGRSSCASAFSGAMRDGRAGVPAGRGQDEHGRLARPGGRALVLRVHPGRVSTLSATAAGASARANRSRSRP